MAELSEAMHRQLNVWNLCCPQADVLAHVVTVVGLLHHHFHVGIHVPHAIVHAAEVS